MNAEEEGVLAQARRAVKSEESHTEGEHLNKEEVSFCRLSREPCGDSPPCEMWASLTSLASSSS